MTEVEIQCLIKEVTEVRNNAYAPYSHFKVGALVIDENGNKHLGVNVENGSFGLTNCAERTAIFSGVTQGLQRIRCIVVVGDTTGPISPCGACRQVISEFSDKDTTIILANIKGEYRELNLDEILPYRFKL